jgi:hypothetical protein
MFLTSRLLAEAPVRTGLLDPGAILRPQKNGLQIARGLRQLVTVIYQLLDAVDRSTFSLDYELYIWITGDRFLQSFSSFPRRLKYYPPQSLIAASLGPRRCIWKARGC